MKVKCCYDGVDGLLYQAFFFFFFFEVVIGIEIMWLESDGATTA